MDFLGVNGRHNHGSLLVSYECIHPRWGKRILGGLKFLIPGLFWVGKFSKYFWLALFK